MSRRSELQDYLAGELHALMPRLHEGQKHAVANSKLPLNRRLPLARRLAESCHYTWVWWFWAVLGVMAAITTILLIYGGFDTLHARNNVTPGNSRGAALLLTAVFLGVGSSITIWVATIVFAVKAAIENRVYGELQSVLPVQEVAEDAEESEPEEMPIEEEAPVVETSTEGGEVATPAQTEGEGRLYESSDEHDPGSF